jgi:hypothetical protein
MKKKLIFTLMVLVAIFFGNIGCTFSTAGSSITYTSESTTTTNYVVVGTHLSLGITLNYSNETVTELNDRYSFSGNVFYIFELDFPETVTMTFERTSLYDEASETDIEFTLNDRVNIESKNSSDESIYNYIVSYLSENYEEKTIGNNISGTTYYMDNDGNILKLVYISENNIYLRISQHCDIFFDSSDGAWFIYPLGIVAINIETSKEILIEGCPSCKVSDIVDNEYTYSYMGYSFKISGNGAVLLNGYYHFSISHISIE